MLVQSGLRPSAAPCFTWHQRANEEQPLKTFFLYFCKVCGSFKGGYRDKAGAQYRINPFNIFLREKKTEKRKEKPCHQAGGAGLTRFLD
ncbi:MAG: hypothetical protein U5L96_06840 [Owenweeksia sp.]|nr:hypothetical protein [Owenweeksia sp.]